MKRYYVAAVFFIIMGGLLAYIRFHQENTEGAIWIGIIFTLLGVVTFFYEKLRSWLRPVGVAVPLIFIGLMAAHAASTGDIASAIFLSIGVIGAGVLHFFQDTPFFKEKIEPYIGIIVLLIMAFFLL